MQKTDADIETEPEAASLTCAGLSLYMGGHEILRGVDMTLPEQGITCLIGPSGAGKSSLLRCMTGLNRDWRGDIYIQGRNVRQWPGGEEGLRRQVGLIAQKPAVFPTSIEENVLFGLNRRQRKAMSRDWVKCCLRQAALWDEVSTRLDAPARALSLGQQQRLCVARALALQPDVLLLDEPTASLDSCSKQAIEQALEVLAADIPILLVTHDLEQVRRLQGQVVFMCDRRVIESGSC